MRTPPFTHPLVSLLLRAWASSASRKPPKPLKNEAIQFPAVLFIDQDNQRHGPLPPAKVLAGLDRTRYDLHLVNPTHQPPIVKAIPRALQHQRERAAQEAATAQRLRQREKEVRFGTAMAERDVQLRLAKVGELLGRAYRVRMVVEGKGPKGRSPVAKEAMQRDLMGRLRAQFAKDLLVLAPPESLQGNLLTLLQCASAKPPSTKPRHQEAEQDADQVNEASRGDSSKV